MILADAGLVTPVAIVLSAAAGVLGALIGIVKLRGDTNSQAVNQAQGAMETMQELNDALRKDRDYWRDRYEHCHGVRAELTAQVRLLEEGRAP